MSCHGSAPYAGLLQFDGLHDYMYLVNIAAQIAPWKLRVKPGDPDASFLVQKLTNTQAPAEGSPMPQGEGIKWRAPDPATLKTLKCWIANGARNN